MRALELCYTRQLAWLEGRLLPRDGDGAHASGELPLQPRCADRAAAYLQHSVELRPIERVWRPMSDTFDAVVAAELLGNELERRMVCVARYTSNRALLAAARALLNERVWVSVHGMCRYSVSRPPYEGALVEAAARVIVAAATHDAE